MGTLRTQLVQQNMLGPDARRARRSGDGAPRTGYPGMATPFAQLVGTLAVLNIVTGKRSPSCPTKSSSTPPASTAIPVAPIDANVLDRIMSMPRTKEILANPPEQPDIAELRRRHGTSEDDDELILKALVPAADLEKMRAPGRCRRDYPMLSSPQFERVQR